MAAATTNSVQYFEKTKSGFVSISIINLIAKEFVEIWNYFLSNKDISIFILIVLVLSSRRLQEFHSSFANLIRSSSQFRAESKVMIDSIKKQQDPALRRNFDSELFPVYYE